MAEFYFSAEQPTRLEDLHIHIGDADLDTLEDHAKKNWRSVPERWLHSFHVPRPPDIPIEDPNKIVIQLEEWIKDNPNHPLVDIDWQTISSEQAANHIHDLAIEGYNVKLEETWLEGGPALRVYTNFYD